MADDGLDERLDHLPFTLREASRAVDDVLVHLLRSEGHDRLPLNALHALVVAQDRRPIVSVAARLRVSPQAASRLVRTLVDHGLATTAPSALDARVRVVDVTEEGEKLLRDLRQHLFVAVTLVTGTVGEDRLVALADELAELALLDP